MWWRLVDSWMLVGNPRLMRDPVSNKRQTMPGHQHQNLSCDLPPPTHTQMHCVNSCVFNPHMHLHPHRCTQTHTPPHTTHTTGSDPYPRDTKLEVSILGQTVQWIQPSLKACNLKLRFAILKDRAWIRGKGEMVSCEKKHILK